jgi:hypothetical protein
MPAACSGATGRRAGGMRLAVGVGSSEDVGELGEAEAACVERVEVVLQRPVMVVGLDAGFPQAAVGLTAPE